MRRIALGILAALFVSMWVGGRVEARQNYASEFSKMYKASHPKLVEKKCAVCHGDDPKAGKKHRNDYGKAFEKALGGTNVKEAQKIKDALKAAEKELPRED